MKIGNKNLTAKHLFGAGVLIIYALGWRIGGLNGEGLQVIAMTSFILAIIANKNLADKRRFIAGLMVVTMALVCLIIYLADSTVAEGLKGIRLFFQIIAGAIVLKGWHLK